MARIAEQLRSVGSAEELHAIMVQIAESGRARWTRTQVLFYLPASLHDLAEEYFQGERLVLPDRTPVQLESVDSVALDQALREADALSDGRAPEEERFRASKVDELEADPPEDDSDVIGNILLALRQEIKEVDRTSPKRYRLTDGRCTGPYGSGFVYLFTWSSEPDLFMPGQLWLDKKSYPARVGRQGEGGKQFELHTEDYLGPTISKAQFQIDPTFLLRAQFDRLKGFRDVYDPDTSLAAQLFHPPHPIDGRLPALKGEYGLNDGQRMAVATARAAALGYVWGPPGTGKTTSLGALIRESVDHGQRVLVLSPYNTAVDQALKAVHSRGPWRRGEIVRLGRISDDVRALQIDLDSLLERRAEETGLLMTARRLHAAVMSALQVTDRPPPASIRRCLEEMGEMVVQVGRGKGRAEEVKRIQAAMKKVRAAFRGPETEILDQAAVVGTTAALSFISPLVYGRPYDHVIVDEASVVRTPDAVLIALMSGARVTFFGDPKQLPSIVQCRTKETDRWLRRTPFDLAGISRPADARGSCVMLRQQHRMAPPIRKLVSDTFYDGALEDGNCPATGRVLVLDTSETPAEATAKWIRMSQSKENLVHRGIVASLLEAIRRQNQQSSVLVLSPFRAQKIAYERERNTNRFRDVRFATVHTSQGDESDIVVIDLVLAPGRGKSRFMDERRTPEFRNLINVAMSRAKRELVLLTHRHQIQSELPGGLLDTVLQRAAGDSGAVVVPGDLRLQPLWREIFPAR